MTPVFSARQASALNTRASSDPTAPVRAIIWIYFWLLLLEGALRKWLLPGYSDALFLVRDPVAMVAYVLALRAGVFPLRPAILVLAVIAVVSLVFSLVNDVTVTVALFGLRTNYFHVPLIFVMAQTMDRGDVVRIGRWVLIMAIPIVGLMFVQFESAPNHWVNATAGGGDALQLRGAMGKIRPPGPFSFVAGTVSYFGFVAAFVFAGWLQAGSYSRLLLVAASAALVVAIPISISRSLLLAVLIVVAFGAVALVADPRRVFRTIGPILAGAGLIAVAANTVYVRAFMTRWDESIEAGSGGFYGNVVERMVAPFIEPFMIAADTPLLGHGIGLGTVAGARLMTGKYDFLLSESETSRIILELGPLLGFAFIGWRVWLTLALLGRSWVVLLARKDVLPWLLAGASFLSVLNGQWGPATTLGFSVLGAGLTLAALNDPDEDESDEPEEEILSNT